MNHTLPILIIGPGKSLCIKLQGARVSQQMPDAIAKSFDKISFVPLNFYSYATAMPVESSNASCFLVIERCMFPRGKGVILITPGPQVHPQTSVELDLGRECLQLALG